jgi:hypothetical protein
VAIECLECPEVFGKTIASLKLYQRDQSAPEILIDFTDGTSFSCSLEVKAALKASLVRTGVGTPDVVQTYFE